MKLKSYLVRSLGILSILCVASCVKPEPPPAPVQEKIASKPAKIPSTHISTGKATSMEMDELFLLQQSDGALIYDVRSPYFYGVDHIPGSINWPHTDYASEIQSRDLEIQKALKAGKKVVVYCFNLGCPEARNVAHKLARRDYHVAVFGSGIDTWRSAGLPLDK